MLQNTNVSTHTNDDIIDDYVMKRIDFRARRLAIQLGFTDEQREDLSQDMVVEVLSAMPKYDPAQSTRKTFLNRVLDNFVKHVIRTEINRRRRECNTPISLDDIAEGYNPVVNDPRQGQMRQTERVDLKQDVEYILSQMPWELKNICILLKTYSITETAKILNVNRTSVYRQLSKIRDYFQQADFNFSDFLRDKISPAADIEGEASHNTFGE